MSRHSRGYQLWLTLGGILLTLLLAAVITFGSFHIPFDPQQWSQVIILYALSTFIVAALLVFGLILVRVLVRLWMERQTEQLGSRFKTKMVLGAMSVSLLPLVFLFFVSYALMNRTLNRWFPHPLEIANAETQNLIRDVNGTDYKRLLVVARQAAGKAGEESSPASPQSLEAAARLATQLGADAAWESDSDGTALPVNNFPVLAAFDPTLKLARRLPDGSEVWTSRSGDFLAARVPLGSRYLIVASRLPPNFLARYSDIEAQMNAYNALYPEIQIFKRQILLTLSLFTVLLIFSTTWFALYLSKQMTVPIQALAKATREIASGDFDTQVQVQAQDELGTLVRSFNEMTAQLADSRRQINEFTRNLQQAVHELDSRRMLIETVLENIPTGVFSLDPAGKILRSNTAARQIFGDAAREGNTLLAVVGNETGRDLQYLIRRALRMRTASRELTLHLPGHIVHAAVTVSALGSRPASIGYVVVVDDLTELLRAQKASAWQEVAQRIAHEIRNPLTPIQLSADRMRRYIERHAENLNASDLARLVGECAVLIGREVGTLEGLVNEFSQFARFPVARLAPADSNAIVRSALAVFDGRLSGVSIHEHFADDLPPIKADAELLRRVIVNLIDNAAEAMEGSSAKHLELTTRWHSGHDTVEIAIADSGQGISPEDKEKLFLPHFSTKDRGTGLGLAIASRVIAEHHGLIRAEDNTPVGARFVIELPAVEPTPAALASD